MSLRAPRAIFGVDSNFNQLRWRRPRPRRRGAYGLSKARAEAIKSFVAKCGVDVDRVYAVGFAGTRRLSDDITEEKGAVNRRVEVHMMPYAPPGRL